MSVCSKFIQNGPDIDIDIYLNTDIDIDLNQDSSESLVYASILLKFFVAHCCISG